MSQIDLKTIQDLMGKRFYIPNYQRGYRWNQTQVKDLLDDIKEFMESHIDASNKENALENITQKNDFYCLQPLVVAESPTKDFRACIQQVLETEDDTHVGRSVRNTLDKVVRWEVIDGQQRLTTIFLILCELGLPDPFIMEYARWGGTSSSNDLGTKVKSLGKKDESGIDSFHLANAKTTIEEYFRDYSVDDKKAFLDILKNKVQFLWYESEDEDPIKVFTRLNIGKIGLTNAELIKALFLRRTNFSDLDRQKIRMQQQEIASRWDEIESTLQNDEFWMFLHAPDFEKPTRIDYLFDLICDMKSLDEYIEVQYRNDRALGQDNYRTFRYFNAYFHSSIAQSNATTEDKTVIKTCWEEVDSIFATFKEWFDDLRLYHYVGFLIDQGVNPKDLLKEWRSEREKKRFLGKIIERIKEKIKECSNLEQQYEIEGNAPKSCCQRLLLLHNIQAVINQNTDEADKYGAKTFYKFPFHLYKSEIWNVEHIDSNTENSLEEKKDREGWLKSAWLFIGEDHAPIKKRILEYFQSAPQQQEFLFEKLYDAISKIIIHYNTHSMDESQKNMIGNFVLLDEHTNKSYGNAIFPMKKMILLGKAQGVEWTIAEILHGDALEGFKLKGSRIGSDPKDKKPKTAFVPPVTLQAFLKAFNPLSNNPYSWDGADAQNYTNNIYEILKDFGVTKSEAAK